VVKTRFILILTLTAGRLLAQPALPTTNQLFAPIANPYSGSWIFYSTNAASGLGFLNGASIPYVMTASNNIVASITITTNGLATTNYVNAATNGFVTAGITNGLATTNFVLAQGYVTSVTTNSLATTNYVNAATNGFVTAAVTNGLATTNFVTAQGYVKVKTVWAGSSGNATLANNTTYYLQPNNSFQIPGGPAGNAFTMYTSAGSSTPIPESMTLTNLYVIVSASPGGANTESLTVLSNGVATTLTVSISGSSTAANDTTHSVTLPAGTQIGVKIVINGMATAADWAWSFEGI
jgi:hypothetical protein